MTFNLSEPKTIKVIKNQKIIYYNWMKVFGKFSSKKMNVKLKIVIKSLRKR